MNQIVRALLLMLAVAAVIAALLIYSNKRSREGAIKELETRFEAQISISESEFFIGCSSSQLKNLEELAALALKIGQPTMLDLTGATMLESLRGAERMTRLTSITAVDCPSLVSADGIAGHPALRELIFADCTKLADVSAIRGLRQLVTLDLSGCIALSSLAVADLPQLDNLYLSRCTQITQIDAAQFPDLEHLYMDGCSGVKEIVGLGNLTELSDLDLSDMVALKDLSGLERLTKLVVLDLRNVKLSDVSGLGKLTSLRVLRMGGQETIRNLEPFSRLESLREIHLESCPNLDSLQGMPSGVSQYAGFTRCPKLTSLAGIESATGLEQLDLSGCSGLTDITAIAKLKSLIQLSLVKCVGVSDISLVSPLPQMAIVMLGGSGVSRESVVPIQKEKRDLYFDFDVAE